MVFYCKEKFTINSMQFREKEIPQDNNFKILLINTIKAKLKFN